MRKTLLSLLILAGWTAGARAQGTILLQNATLPSSTLVYTNNGRIGLAQSFTVQLYGGALGSSEAQLMAGGPLATFFTGPNAGGYFYDPVSITVPGSTAGSGTGSANNAELDIIGWPGNYSSLDAAFEANGFIWGDTGPFANATGGAGSPHAAPANLNGFPGLILEIPEPSTLALGGLGAVIMLLFRRYKQAA